MAKKLTIDDNFFKLTPEQQAKEVERLTKVLVNRLPSLKKNLKMYSETSSELYNLSAEEVNLIGTTYANAIKGGEISTPSSKKAYNSFIKNLRKYTRTSIKQLAYQTANERMDSWLENVKASSSESDIEYAQELYNSMSDDEKLGFTRSKYFMDSSYMYMVVEEDNVQYSIQTLKLELYLEEVRNKQTKHIYRDKVKKSEDKLRNYKKRR